VKYVAFNSSVKIAMTYDWNCEIWLESTLYLAFIQYLGNTVASKLDGHEALVDCSDWSAPNSMDS
jgi:hypothetical protein